MILFYEMKGQQKNAIVILLQDVVLNNDNIVYAVVTMFVTMCVSMFI